MKLAKALLVAATSLSAIDSAEAQTNNIGSLFFDCVKQTDDGQFLAQFKSATRLMNEDGTLTDMIAQAIESHSDINGAYTFETMPPNVDMLLRTHNDLLWHSDPESIGYPSLLSDNAHLLDAADSLKLSEEKGMPTPGCDTPYLGS